MLKTFKPVLLAAGTLVIILFAVFQGGCDASGPGTQTTLSVEEDRIRINGKETKLIGLRLSAALISDKSTRELIDNLDTFASYGINSFSVYLMGSRFGDIKGYLPDATLNPEYTKRLERVITAADQKGMVVLVGCLYWGTSRAKEDLAHWTEDDAAAAVYNTVAWLSEKNFTNVFVDVDNEGMAQRINGWDQATLLAAAKQAGPAIPRAQPVGDWDEPDADLRIHFASPQPDINKPYIATEATPKIFNYWATYSKETFGHWDGDSEDPLHNIDQAYYNYSRIGRYTDEMKTAQIEQARNDIDNHNGHFIASTWLQASDDEGVGGPFIRPGGYSIIEDVDEDIDRLHPDAGIRWWLEFIRDNYGPWEKP